MVCKVCGATSEKGRRYCKRCYADRRKEIHGGALPKYQYEKSKCIVCQCEITKWRKTQQFCKKCCQFSTGLRKAGHSVISTLTRRIASEFLGRKLSYNEVVHHLDENPDNNSFDNLLIISRKAHGSLHAFLRKQRAALEQSSVQNIENCWNILRASLTTAWLETAGANVIRIAEIGQPAAEPLSIGEGSETMHDTPEQSGDDIVQTTTSNIGSGN